MRGYIVKRGNSFSAVVYLGKDPATAKERRKWVAFRTRREAEAYLSQIVAQVQGGDQYPQRDCAWESTWSLGFEITRPAPSLQRP